MALGWLPSLMMYFSWYCKPGDASVCFQDVMVWTVRATRSWALPQRIQRSRGSVTPVRMEWLPAVSCAPTRMASSKRRTPEGGTLTHTDPSVICHLLKTASAPCSRTNNTSVNGLSGFKYLRQYIYKLNCTYIQQWREEGLGLRRRERTGRGVEKRMEGGEEIEEEKEWEKRVLCEAWRLQPRYRW